MIAAAAEKDHYLSGFESFAKGRGAGAPSWLRAIRQGAIARFAEAGFPTTRDEEWKYTSVDPIVKVPFKPARAEAGKAIGATLDRLGLGVGAGGRLVFVNGYYQAHLSSTRGLPQGVRAGSLAQALEAVPESLEAHLAQYADYQNHPFVALNTAFMEDGALVYLPKGRVVREPIHLIFVSAPGGEPALSHPRNLIVVEEAGQAVIVEHYVDLEGGLYLTNAVTEIALGEGAAADHYKLEEEGGRAFHIATLQAHLGRNSLFSSHSISIGGALTRNDANAVIEGEGGDCTLNGLYLAAGGQHIDNHTRIDHVSPHGTSRELYKGILDGRAKGVFNGKIYVHKAAQKTDAKQTNKNLLLSADATINTKPQLEIYADDVKCAHGSTIGRLDEEALFYLRSRGIGLETARGLLIYAFASDITGRIKVDPIRDRLDRLLMTRFQRGAATEEKA